MSAIRTIMLLCNGCLMELRKPPFSAPSSTALPEARLAKTINDRIIVSVVDRTGAGYVAIFRYHIILNYNCFHSDNALLEVTEHSLNLWDLDARPFKQQIVDLSMGRHLLFDEGDGIGVHPQLGCSTL
jgi:hypothetical protein